MSNQQSVGQGSAATDDGPTAVPQANTPSNGGAPRADHAVGVVVPADRLRVAEVEDSRRALRYTAPLFAVGMVLESASHAWVDSPVQLVLTPALAAVVCAVLSWRYRRGAKRSRYPQWTLFGLLVLLLIVVWQHIFVGSSLLSAIFSGMAVTACAALIMPALPAVLAIVTSWLGLIFSLIELEGGLPAASFPLPVLTLGMAYLIYTARRRSIFLAEQALVLQEEVARQESIARERVNQLNYAGTIAQGLAHNLSNQLQVQVASLELASVYLEKADFADAENIRAHIQRATEASDASTALVEKLQSYAGFSSQQPQSQDVRELSETLAKADAAMSQIEIVQNCGPGLTIVADRSALVSSLRELVRNADRAVRESDSQPGRIVLVISEQEHSGQLGVAFDLSDNGGGFPRDLLETASEPFVTSQPAARSGLGLSAISGFARMHDGRLSVLTTSEIGSTVRLWLPLNPVRSYEA